MNFNVDEEVIYFKNTPIFTHTNGRNILRLNENSPNLSEFKCLVERVIIETNNNRRINTEIAKK